MESITSTQIYEKDLHIVEDYMNRKQIKCRRDAIRIAVEFTNAHGGFS